MSRRLSLSAKIRSSFPEIGLILVVSAGLVGAVLLLHFWKGFEVNMLIRDPVGFLRSPFYVGFYSQIGILLWASAVSVCFLCAVMHAKLGENKFKIFFFASGFLTLMLLMDDAFMFHEQVFPRFFGISEKMIYTSYLVLILLYLGVFRSTILDTNFVLFGMALMFFGFSIFVDFLEIPWQYGNLLEDSAKMVGIISWLVYFFRTGAATLLDPFSQKAQTP